MPVLHHGPVPIIDINKWAFTISGLVSEERRLDFYEFVSLPRVKVFSDIHCVTSWSRLDNLWEGVSTGAIRELVNIKPRPGLLLVHAAGGFTTKPYSKRFFETDVLFAVKHDGDLLTQEHGGPVKTGCPRLYFWKSAKWATGVEFVERGPAGVLGVCRIP